MPIGLDANQILSVFVESFNKTQNRIDVEKLTADMGLNPKTKELIELLRSKMSNIPFDQLMIALSVAFAIAEGIVANNEALAKVIPHFEK